MHPQMAIQSDKEFPSLLFTPRLPERERESSFRTRSPKSTRSPSTPAHGRSSGLRDRRRSLTPYSGAKDTTPPPPPFLSILDANQGDPRFALQYICYAARSISGTLPANFHTW